jgi:hypothetical protein
LNVSSPERVSGLLKKGRDLLRAGRSRDAALAFGRILLRNPSHAAARRGLARASAAVDESRRDHEARLDEARHAFEAGDALRSRALLESLAASGEEGERAMALLDRLDAREGRVGPLAGADASTGDAVAAGVVAARPPWLRRAVLACWSVLIVSMGAGLAVSWQRIVGGLLEPPAPASRKTPPVTEIAAPRAGERALKQASRLLAQGDAAGAVAALEDVPADDPAYPFSLRLRLEAQAALTSAGDRP